MAGDVSGQLAAVGVPAGVALGLLRQARALAIEREHAIGIERQQVRGVEILRVLERTAGEPHRRQRQRPRARRRRRAVIFCAKPDDTSHADPPATS